MCKPIVIINKYIKIITSHWIRNYKSNFRIKFKIEKYSVSCYNTASEQIALFISSSYVIYMQFYKKKKLRK